MPQQKFLENFAKGKDMPYMSVMVCSYNRQGTIEYCLRSIRKSDYHDYELIVVDCGSRDETVSIAKKYTDNLIEILEEPLRINARRAGIKAAKGDVVVNVDSDVVIRPDTLSKIADYFSRHSEIDALTGLLSKEHPNRDFFSQYKNLYMHYIFRNLPERVTFLYGSIEAARLGAFALYDSRAKIADDTDFGQRLTSSGKNIAFLKDLEVVHLKKHNMLTFIKNDFNIPFNWAQIFLRFKGWKELLGSKVGFAHASKGQLAGIIVACLIVALAFNAALGHSSLFSLALLMALWGALNFKFLFYLATERGVFFGVQSVFITFLDNLVMAAGILCGFITFFMKK